MVELTCNIQNLFVIQIQKKNSSKSLFTKYHQFDEASSTRHWMLDTSQDSAERQSL